MLFKKLIIIAFKLPCQPFKSPHQQLRQINTIPLKMFYKLKDLNSSIRKCVKTFCPQIFSSFISLMQWKTN